MHVSVNGLLLWSTMMTMALLSSSSSSTTLCQAFSFLPATRVVAPAKGRRGGRSKTVDSVKLAAPMIGKKKKSPIKVEKVTPEKKKPTKFGAVGLQPKGTRAVVANNKKFQLAAPTIGKTKKLIKVKTGTPEKNKKQKKPTKFGAVGRQPKGTRAVVANTKKQAPPKKTGRPGLTVKKKPTTKAAGAKKEERTTDQEEHETYTPGLGF